MIYLFFAKESITMESNSLVVGDLGTNASKLSDFDIDYSAEVVDGDLQVGPEATDGVINSLESKKVVKDGVVKRLPEERNYPLPLFPRFPDDLPDREFNSSLTTIDKDGWYDEIKLTGNRELVIDVGDDARKIRITSLIINSGEITIIGDGTLELYIDEEFQVLGNGSFINKGGDPNKVVVYYRGNEDLNLHGQRQIVGSLYTYYADIALGGSGSILGHIVSGGDYITFNGNYYNEYTKDFVRIIYAPLATLDLRSRHDGLSGAVVCNRLILGDDFSLNEFFIQEALLPFDFVGGTPYIIDHWEQ